MANNTVRYYVGDLCYVLTDEEWNRVCYHDFYGDQNTYNEDDEEEGGDA